MERFIPIPKDYYDEGFNICEKDGITFNEGVTILVGCNGYGKTTTLQCIEEELRQQKIPFIKHDNHTRNNKHNTMEEAMFHGNYSLVSTAAFSSEGENINISLGNTLEKLHKFLQTGKSGDMVEVFAEIFSDEEEKEIPKERWLLFDAVDSGYSIDNIIDFKEVLDLIMEDSKKLGVTTYIVITANSYEMTVGYNCIDVYTAETKNFKSYEDYRVFIMETKDIKEKRYKDNDDEET